MPKIEGAVASRLKRSHEFIGCDDTGITGFELGLRFANIVKNALPLPFCQSLANDLYEIRLRVRRKLLDRLQDLIERRHIGRDYTLSCLHGP